MIRSCRYKHRWGITFLFAVLGIWSLFVLIANGEIERKRVLFISSYTENFMTVPEQIKGIQNIFENENVNLDIEYMDTKRFDTDEKKQQFFVSLKYNLEHLPRYDVVIVGDDNALDFAVKYQEELFHEIPIVFLGVNNMEKAEEVARDPYITGIIEETSLKENIEIAIKFNEDATKVVAIVDETLTGKGDENQFLKAKEYFPDLDFEVVHFSDYSFKEFGAVIENIDEDTILLFLSMNQDKNGVPVSIENAVDLLKKYAKVPVYRPLIGGVGQGLIGGNMVSYVKSGEIAASMAMDILKGTPVETIDVITESPNQYFFDYELIKKYEIDEELIPKGSVLINKKSSIYEEYKQIIIFAILVLLFLTILIVILLMDNIKTRRMGRALRESNDELSITTEELLASQEELQNHYDTIQSQVNDIKILNQKYEIAIQSTEAVVWKFNAKDRTINISGNIKDIFLDTDGKDKNIDDVMDGLLNPEGEEIIKKEYKRYINGETTEINIQIFLNHEVGKKWMMIRGKGVYDLKEEVNYLHGIIMDITKIKNQEEYIDYLAHHDYLTKLPNRMTFMKRLEEVVIQGDYGVVIMLDIDNFKGINDTLGHMYGDTLLVQVAKRLVSISDDKLFVSRFGGDEFLLLLTGVSTQEEILVYVHKVRQLFEQTFQVERRVNFINFSMGITCFPEDSKDINQLIMNADTAMYQVKHGGKNNYMFYHANMQNELKRKNVIEEILREALENDGFELYYQPLVDAKTGHIFSFEALLRLKEHKISPGEFIPVAEERGLINKLGRWVTQNAIMQLSIWKEKGLTGKKISINFSSQQIKDKEYIDFLVENLKNYNVSPCSLEIEITESIFLEESKDTSQYLSRLKEIGLDIALDDFGTGFSSLNYLTYMPVDMIKLDKSLNDKFLEDDVKRVIYPLISLAHSLELKITAEGIERKEQYYRLKNGGCDYIQGFLFSRPLKVEDVESIYYKNMIEIVL